MHRPSSGAAWVCGGAGASGRVDVEGDVLLGGLVGQVEQLRDKQVGHLVVHALPEQQDAVLEQPGHDVHLVVTRANHRQRQEAGPRTRRAWRVLAPRVNLGLLGLVHRRQQDTTR